MPREIIVVGGSGFIGKRVVWLLKLHGYNPIVFDRKNGLDILKDPLPDAGIVIHLAARLFDKFDENLAMTKKVCQSKCHKIIFTSSAAVYGNGLNHKEEDKPHPFGKYGRVKLKEEELIKTSGKAYAILRLANVYGFDTDHGVVYRFMNGLDIVNGNGEQVRDFIWVEDVAKVIFEAATTKKYNGVYNISTGKQTKIIDLFKQLFPDREPVHGPLLKEIQLSCLCPDKAKAKGFKPRNLLYDQQT